MALPSRNDLKDYLRIETSVEDALLDQLIAEATAWAEVEIDRPIQRSAQTFVDEACTNVVYGVVRSLMIPITPVQLETPSPVVRDSRNEVVDATTYTVDSDSGIITARAGCAFGRGPYTIEATVGLECAPNYATVYEPLVSALILGYASDLYHRRNPNVASEGTGGGATVSYFQDDTQQRLERIKRLLSPIGVV